MDNKESAQYWRNIKPHSIITLRDEQGIEDSLEKEGSVKGVDYEVNSIQRIMENNSLAEWLFFNLADKDQNVWLMVKIVDEQISLKVYFEVDEFEQGNRKDIIEREDLWLFEKPEDLEHFDYNDLKYALEIIQPTDKGKIIFRQKGQGELFGTCTQNPVQSGMEEIFTTIVEYDTVDDCDNPELLILELGDNKEGGVITLMLGTEINLNEVEVMAI